MLYFDEFINEEYRVFKRKYTEKHPSKRFYSNSGRVRNRILNHIAYSTMNKEEIRGLLRKLGSNDSWLSRNKWLFKFYKDGTMCLNRNGRNMLKIIGYDQRNNISEHYFNHNKLTEKDLDVFEKIFEKAKSVAQQRLMGQAYALKTGDLDEEDIDPKYRETIKDLADSMTKKELEDFAETEHEGLPDEVKEQELHLNPGMNLPAMGSVQPGEGGYTHYDNDEDSYYNYYEQEDELTGVQNEFEGGAESEIVKHLTDNIKNLTFVDADGNMEFGNYLLQFDYNDKYVEMLFEVPGEYNPDDVIKNVSISVQNSDKTKEINNDSLEKISILDTDYIEDLKSILDSDGDENENDNENDNEIENNEE